MVRAFRMDASWTPPWGDVSGMSIWEETPRKTQDTLERLYLSAGLGTPLDPLTGAGGSSRGQESLVLPFGAAATATLKMDGWMASQ